MIKERPILFTPDNAQKVHLGLKTQTRRVIKSQPTEDVRYDGIDDDSGIHYWEVMDGDKPTEKYIPFGFCPYGKIGDRLWVREALTNHMGEARYLADDTRVFVQSETGLAQLGWSWKNDILPSIHMPRIACRTVLEITNIRAEHLQDISEADAIAEGIEVTEKGIVSFTRKDGSFYVDHAHDPVNAYLHLWEDIHGEDTSEDNPFVWVVEFKKVKG